MRSVMVVAPLPAARQEQAPGSPHDPAVVLGAR